MRLLDPRFRYVPSARTDILATWRRFGFSPTTDVERRARQRASELADSRAGRSADIDLVRDPSPSDQRRETAVAE